MTVIVHKVFDMRLNAHHHPELSGAMPNCVFAEFMHGLESLLDPCAHVVRHSQSDFRVTDLVLRRFPQCVKGQMCEAVKVICEGLPVVLRMDVGFGQEPSPFSGRICTLALGNGEKLAFRVCCSLPRFLWSVTAQLASALLVGSTVKNGEQRPGRRFYDEIDGVRWQAVARLLQYGCKLDPVLRPVDGDIDVFSDVCAMLYKQVDDTDELAGLFLV